MNRPSHVIRKLAYVTALLCVSACASIISKTDYPVNIDSNPSGVSFFITNTSGATVHNGTTPATVTLNTRAGYFKSQAYTIHLQRAGMPTKEYAIRSGMDGWYWGNLLLGGLLGMIVVDPLTGAMFKLPPEVVVQLDQPVAQAAGDRVLHIGTLDSLTDAQRSQLVALTD